MAESFVWDQAGDEEFARARQLERVSLFVELNLDHDEIVRTRDLFGQLIRDHRRTHGLARLIDRFPALTLTTLIGHAGLSYEQGKYWESFWSELAMDREQEFESLLRTKLTSLLRKFKLREFPEISNQQYVQTMAVHAGVPVHCLNDLVDVIEQHISHGRDPSGSAVFEWLTQPGLEYRMNNLDVPVRNFLQFGGEAAVDIVDRIIEFAEYAREHPEVANDLDLDTSTTGLPSVMLEALIDRFEERPFGSSAVDSGRTGRSRRPVIAYSRSDDQVVVEVPFPDEAPEVPWLVSFDGDSTEVYAERGWGLGAGEVHPPTPIPVPRRVREVVLRHDASLAHHRIALVDKDNPLLLFDHNGRPISRHLALPRGEVVGVHPATAELIDGHSGEPVAFTAEAVPAGWRDWRARVYDLAGIDSVRLRRERLLGPVQQVRRVGAARLEFADPVEGVFTRSGLPVYGERPAVTLPVAGAEQVAWRVRVRRSGTTDWLADDEWESGSELTELDPFDGIAPGLLGMFDIVISGPLGQDIRHSLFMAEGLSVEHESTFRVPTPDGLSPAATTIEIAPPLAVDRDFVEFPSAQRDSEFRVSLGESVERLVLRPPHIEFRVDQIGATARWRTVAPILTVDDLTEHLIVAVRVPGDVLVDIALSDSAGRIRQTEIPQLNRDNLFQISSRAFADTARSLRTATLLARIDTPDGGTTQITVARVQPRLLCSGIRLDGTVLVFDGTDSDDLAAFVWPETAPWRPPTQIEIVEGKAPLPSEFVDAGPLTVQVFVDDPWAVITAPVRPDDTAYRVVQHGWLQDSDPVRTDLAKFLAGAGDPPTTGTALTEVWTAYASRYADSSLSPFVRSGLLRVLGVDPRTSLEALERSALPQAQLPALLIRTGLVDKDFSSYFRLGKHANPWLGCLIDIADLPNVALQSAQESAEELRADLAAHGGPALLELLSGTLREVYTGHFERNTIGMHRMAPEQIAALKDACEIVPGALLDPDTRRAAMFEAFARRLDWQRDPASQAMTTHSAVLTGSLRRASPWVYDVVKARSDALTGVDTGEFPWMLMSMQSLLFAAVARLQARSVMPQPVLTAPMRQCWARLAELCPGLVGADLLIADALASHVLHNDVINKIGVHR
ncbi:hypothetical protein [Nocardia sp. GTS18]|uniref:hypothetical protein n=1 Tax=Nocardia sp. GTS18 TaxID=1778064 RepID=UPI0021061ADA|nr:hypothetical protein [Nocardia sp. GTS18]